MQHSYSSTGLAVAEHTPSNGNGSSEPRVSYTVKELLLDMDRRHSESLRDIHADITNVKDDLKEVQEWIVAADAAKNERRSMLTALDKLVVGGAVVATLVLNYIEVLLLQHGRLPG